MPVNKDQLAEIEELRSIKSETIRPSSPELESIPVSYTHLTLPTILLV